jgi:putative oxidoreductase
MSVLFLIGRIIVGAYYIYNGINHFLKLNMMTAYAKSKGVPLPEFSVVAAGILLLVAGMTLLLGYYPEIGVVALVLFFIPVSLMMHNFWAVGPEEKAVQMINFTKNMALLGSALMFLKIGKPWPFSLGR